MAESSSVAEGRQVPFRIRIGVTGHRALTPDASFVDAVSKRIEQIGRTLVPPSTATEVKLAVVSSLAVGGDRIVVRAVRAYAGDDVRLEVVLPLKEDDFAEVQEFDVDARAEFDDFVRAASFKRVLSGPWSKRDPTIGYEAASRYVVRRSDIVIALWDGEAKRGRGGTAPTLLAAAGMGKPCIWIPTKPQGEGALLWDNLGRGTAEAFLEQVQRRVEGSSEVRVGGERRGALPRDTLRSLRNSYERLDSFNRHQVESSAFTARRDWPSWCLAPYVRAGRASAHNKRRYDLLTWAMALLATGAAAALAAGLTVWQTVGAAILEVVCLTALVATFGLLKWRRYHSAWLSCRLLAERLRSARYVAPTGVDFRRSAEGETIFVDETAADWSVRAFEEVWDSRPRQASTARMSKSSFEALKQSLAAWLQGQIDYHRRAARRHELDHVALTGLAAFLLLGAIVFPFFHVAGYEEAAAIFCSITLPVAAASVGVIRTIRQHHALAERFLRMERELESVRAEILDAPTEAKLRRTASDAARTVANEAGDWFGTMWFLDVDQPA